jgi:Ca2+-binding EF-hand superfamily protein
VLQEYQYFKSILSGSTHIQRKLYESELRRNFDECDPKRKGNLDRSEFSMLMTGYFVMKAQKPTKKNLDMLFARVDCNNDKHVDLEEFIQFADAINEKEVMPVLQQELLRRGQML